MIDWQRRRALETRYDGPLPSHAAIHADCGEAWARQAATRRRLAWQEVRRIGRQAARARNDFYAVPGGARFLEWQLLRRNLAWKLRNWEHWRGLTVIPVNLRLTMIK